MHLLRTSLRSRLLILILLPLIAVSSIAVVWRFNEAKKIAEEVFDRNLIMLTLAISRDVTLSEGDTLSETTSNLFKQASGGDVFYHVYGPDGSFVTGYSSPPIGATEAKPENNPIAFTATHLGRPVRVVKLIERTTVDGISGRAEITVWQKLDLRQGFARDLALRAGLLAALLVFTVAALVLFGIRRGLQPLIELEKAIQIRSSDDLSPIERRVPKESEGIVKRLNALFEQVTESNQARDRFISNAAHQLRNPVAGIHSMAQATLGAKTLEESKKRASELLEETRRTGRLTDQLLSLERLNGRSPQFQPLNIGELVSDIGQRNAAQILGTGIDFSIHVPDVALMINGDSTMLTEAIQNLIDNAVAHGGDTMRFITVSVQQTQNTAEVVVTNDGAEISKAAVGTIFERFAQSDKSEGAGLGLAISSEIARLNNGETHLTTRPNTSFTLRLPTIPH